MPRLQKVAAAISEAALYVLMLLQPLTGLAQSVARGKPFQLFVFQAPALMARDRALAGRFHALHEQGAWMLLGLIGLHVAAALFHGLGWYARRRARVDVALADPKVLSRQFHPFAVRPPNPVAAAGARGRH